MTRIPKTTITPYAQIDEVITHLLQKLQTCIPEKLSGFYIGGSLANNSFDDKTSDIDCYILLISPLSKTELKHIEQLHQHLYQSFLPWGQKIEASYSSLEDLSPFEKTRARPYFNEGRFYFAEYGANFKIELALLREKGLTVIGPELSTLIPVLSSSEFKQTIQENLMDYWRPLLDEPTKLARPDYQLFAILTMCRTLYSFKTGQITSKRNAALWALENEEIRWHSLIEKALQWTPNQAFQQEKETRGLIQDTVDKICNLNRETLS